MNALDILTKARNLLAENFCEGTLFDSYGNYCALGAVNKAAKVNQNYYRPRRNGTAVQRAVFFLANAATGKTRSLSENHVAFVNDDLGKESMLKVFDQAIRNAKRRHVSKKGLFPQRRHVSKKGLFPQVYG